MPVVDFKRNSNSKGINKKSKNIKSISNSNLSEEAERILLILNLTHLPKNTLKNSDKTLKSLKNTYKDKKKLILKDQKLHNQISKNKETNLPKKGLTMTISTKTISYQTDPSQTFKTEANLHMTHKKGNQWSCK